jgi:signal peptidase II
MFPLLPIGGLILLLDQITKFLILYRFPLHSGMEVIPGFFNIVHVRNPGAAFSLMASAPAIWRQFFFIGLTIVVVIALIYSYSKVAKEDLWTKTSYTLIVSGAVGNLIDRVRLGEVIDFLDVYIGSYHWPAFNVADSAITAGAIMLLLSLLRGR